MNQMRRHLYQRFEYEPSQVQSRMRQSEKLCITFNLAVQKEIEIDCARAIFDITRAPEQKFDPQQTRHHLLWRRQRISDLNHHVEKGRLFNLAHRRGLIDG